MSVLNDQIKEAIDSFDLPRARELLRDALKEADGETYYLASRVALDDEQKQEFLKKAVELDPFHEKAREGLKSAAAPVSPPNTPTPVKQGMAQPPQPQSPPISQMPPNASVNMEHLFTERKYKLVVENPGANVKAVIAYLKTASGQSDLKPTFPFELVIESDVLFGIEFGKEDYAAKGQQHVVALQNLGATAQLVEFEGRKNLKSIVPPDGGYSDGMDLFWRFNAVSLYVLGAICFIAAILWACTGFTSPSSSNPGFFGIVIAFVVGFILYKLGEVSIETLNKRALQKGYYQQKGGGF